MGFAGANVTVPHKQAAFDLVDEVDASARRCAAVNTVVVKKGRLVGSNSDGSGFLDNLRAACAAGAPDWDRGPALILGAGGAARAVVAALLDHGVECLRLANRTAAHAEALLVALGAGRAATVVPWAERQAALDDASLVVNTTSLGLAGQEHLELDLAALGPTAVVSDLVYNPLETPLLAAARSRGNTVADGLGMLMHQAVTGFAAWFGCRPEVDEDLRRHLVARLAAQTVAETETP
jgi:shikimate dehydrogenase